MKLKFRKSDEMRIYRLVSSLETHEKKSANKFKTFRKELDRFIISGRKMRGEIRIS